VSTTKGLNNIERRDRYVAQNGARRLTPAQRHRLAKKAREDMGSPDNATPKRPKAATRAQAMKGRKRFYAEFE
jgi:hypothetical protein